MLKRLFEHTFTPINKRGEMDKRQIRKQGCVGASEERAHDSDVTDEISELAGLAETASWRSAAGPHVHVRSGWRTTPTGRSSQPLCETIESLQRMSGVFVDLLTTV